MNEILVPILIIAALIAFNAIFVAAEFAIIGAPRATIERRAQEGHRVAQLVRDILHDPRRQDRYIATAQLGITFASLGLGMYGEHVLAHWIDNGLHAWGWGENRIIAAHTLATILAIAILTYFHIVVGEMVPKSMALMHAEKTVLRITPPMMLIKTILFPLVVALNGLGNGILRLIGIQRQFTANNYTSEELEYIVNESQQGGLLRESEGTMLRDLFEFGERTAREVMVPRVHLDGLPLGCAPHDLAHAMRDSRRTRYPVYEGDLDHIKGMIHIKDALRLLHAKQPLSEAEVRPTAFVPESAPLDSVLETMRVAKTQMVVVMDEHGGTAGIVTVEDLCVEVVGEVEEGSDEIPDIQTLPGGSLRVTGTVRLDDVGEAFGRVLEHPEVDTASGLVLALLGRPPAVGDKVVYEGVQLEVTAIEGHGVSECTATLLAQATDEDTS